jgi:hypothetical protein
MWGMKLLELHPQILGQSCDACRRWVFDEHHRKLLRQGRPVARPTGAPTPCHACPKRNPTLGRRFERDLVRISHAVNRYFEVRASFGQCLTPAERGDALTQRNLSIVDQFVRRTEAASSAAAGGGNPSLIPFRRI